MIKALDYSSIPVPLPVAVPVSHVSADFTVCNAIEHDSGICTEIRPGFSTRYKLPGQCPWSSSLLRI